jgi:16S rRNA (guanine(966)-N(2))-methyltransferase RsmD
LTASIYNAVSKLIVAGARSGYCLDHDAGARGRELRIIAGSNHGRRLVAPRGLDTRPATARVRSSIFSRIESRCEIAETRVLDLFAGSGSLGLEALSRGAAEAIFVDSSRGAIAAILRNLRQFSLEARAHVIQLDVVRALSELAADNESFDLVFVDPPFPQNSSGEVLAKLTRLDLINPHGIIIVRQYQRAPDLVVAELERVSLATLGDHRITLYRRVDAAAAETVV